MTRQAHRLSRICQLASIVLAILGAVDALYLWVLKYTQREAMCIGSYGCVTVSNSPYSQIGNIPVAALGLFAYMVIATILCLESRSTLVARYGPLGVFGLTLIGVIFSAYLTYLELYVIHAVCPFCVVSAVLMMLIFILSLVRLVQQIFYT